LDSPMACSVCRYVGVVVVVFLVVALLISDTAPRPPAHDRDGQQSGMEWNGNGVGRGGVMHVAYSSILEDSVGRVDWTVGMSRYGRKQRRAIQARSSRNFRVHCVSRCSSCPTITLRSTFTSSRISWLSACYPSPIRLRRSIRLSRLRHLRRLRLSQSTIEIRYEPPTPDHPPSRCEIVSPGIRPRCPRFPRCPRCTDGCCAAAWVGFQLQRSLGFLLELRFSL
jgi:hypothetical protein